MEKLYRKKKNKVMNYICPIFRFATQTFNGGYKRKMKIVLSHFVIIVAHFVINLQYMVGGQVNPIISIIIDNNINNNNK